MPCSASFHDNPVRIMIAHACTEVVFKYADGEEETGISGKQVTLKGDVRKIKCKYSSGERKTYAWKEDVVFKEAVEIIAGLAKDDDVITFIDEEGNECVAEVTSSKEGTQSSLCPSHTAFFIDSTLIIGIGGGYTSVTFTFADGREMVKAPGDEIELEGAVIKITCQDLAGDDKIYLWRSDCVFDDEEITARLVPQENSILFEGDEDTKCVANMVLSSTEQRPATCPSHTVFFLRNDVEVLVTHGCTEVSFTHVNGEIKAVTPGGSISLKGAIIKVACTGFQGDRAAYFWRADVEFPARNRISVKGPDEGVLIFEDEDGTKARAVLAPSTPTVSSSSSLGPLHTIIFTRTNVSAFIGDGYTDVTFTYADATEKTVKTGDSTTLKGAIIKVTCKDAKGRRESYLWADSGVVGASIINIWGPVDNVLLFKPTIPGEATHTARMVSRGMPSKQPIRSPAQPVFFQRNLVKLRIAGGYSSITFLYADGQEELANPTEIPYLNGAVVKVMCKDYLGNCTEYFWKETVAYRHGVCIRANGPSGNTLTFDSEDDVQAVAVVSAARPPRVTSDQRPQHTVFFRANEVTVPSAEGHSGIIFTYADGTEENLSTGRYHRVDGAVVKLAVKDEAGKITTYFWNDTAIFEPLEATSVRVSRENVVSVETDDGRSCSAKMVTLPVSAPARAPWLPSDIDLEHTSFFVKNKVKLEIAGSYSTVIFTYADGDSETIPTGASGMINGAVVKVTGRDSKGNETDYFWESPVTFKPHVLIHGKGPVDRILTFLSTDDYTATAMQADE